VCFEALKVGELARRTRLTIRTLHHYDEIGLLRPSLHTESGHRLYTAGDVARLQQVLSLRQLGFSLEEIRDCLDRPDFSPLEVIRRHVARLREQIELQRGLCERLEALAYFASAGEVSAEDLLQTIEVMSMIESYYTPEQVESFRKRGAEAAAAGVTERLKTGHL
jgi:MerR family transcriptional regulator, thiopeptide resistance regulator